MKKLGILLLMVFCLGVSNMAEAQSCTNVPVINSFSPITGFIGSKVEIIGANFDSNTIENNIVYFGSTKAVVLTATFGKLEVIVPVGASTDRISVTNACDLTAFSAVPFNGIFCPTPIEANTYNNSAQILPVTYGAYNMISFDMDLDGRPEVLSASNGGGLSVAKNNSTPGNISFSHINMGSRGGQSIYAADFDGDGLKDIVTRFNVWRNTSTGPGDVSLSGTAVSTNDISHYQVAAGDFNKDGKVDIIGDNGNTLYIARNTSSGPGSISFAARQAVATTGGVLNGIQVGDVDGDGKADVLANQRGTSNALFWRNTTPDGSLTFSFASPVIMNTGGTGPYRSQIADFNKDGKIDYVTVNYDNPNFNTAVFINNSTPGNISFNSPLNLPSPNCNYRVQVGDVDGDGYPDIVSKSLCTNVFSVYRNTTTATNATSFAPRFDYTSSAQAEVSGIVIGDLDGDFVPDIATSGVNSNQIRFHRNNSSQDDTTAPTAIAQNIVVALSPQGTVTVAASQVDNGSSDACGISTIVLSQTDFTCADIGENQVTLTVTDNAGNVSTATATVNVQPAAIIVSGQTTVCQGETIPLTANLGDSYQWFNNGQVITGATNRNYTATETGSYTVSVTNAGGCSGTSLATDVTVNGNPVVDISGRTEAYCPGESLVAAQSSLYQWFKNGNLIPNATLQEFFPDGPGTYSVDVIDLFGCSATGSVTINPDTQVPTITLNGAIQVTVDSDTQFNDPGATGTDNCSTEIIVTSNLDLATPGVYTIAYKAVDGSGNESTTVTRQVTVLDATAPIVRAGRIIVELDENGQASVDPASLNNGSTDNSNGQLTFTLDVSAFDCDDLVGGSGSGGTPVAMTSVGTKTLENYSVGASFNPNNGEYWMPQWAGTNVYRLDANGSVLGTFNSGADYMMQLWIDQDSETEFYTSHWSRNYFSKRNTSGQEIWRYNVVNGQYASGISTDSEFAYVVGYQGDRIDVLDKMTGQFQRSINLPGRVFMYGALVIANERIYLGAQAENWSSRPNNWSTIHELDMNGNYISSIATQTRPSNIHFDGEVIWSSDFSNFNEGFRVSNGNAYEDGGIEVTLTGTDAAGNSASDIGIVSVVDNLAPTISLNGDQTVQVISGGSFNDPGATAADNCSATVETTGTVNTNTAGSYTLTYKAVDGSGNESAVITRTVNVIDISVTTKDITVSLDANGNYTLDPSEVDNGSVLGGGSLSIDVTQLNCSNVGNPVTVTLTVTSGIGSTATGTALVTVVDDIAPVISTQGATVQLNQSGQGSIVLSDILLSSSDACGIASEVASQLVFDCSNVGANAVTITVTDNNGQITQQTVNVEVLDVLSIVAQNDAITLDTCAPITFSVADLLGNDSDPYGEELKVDFVGQPSSGTIVDNNNGTFTYTPGQSTNHTATAEYLVKRNDGTIVFSGNGHFYEFVSAPGINWANAKAAAEARTYNGQSGYLVTITSAEENQFAFSKISAQGWIGASDAAVEGEWRWAGGPEAGQLFWSGLANGGPVNGAYNAWGGGEPNNAGNEDYAHFRTDGRWNDYPLSVGGGIQGYVVEYGGTNTDCNIESTATAQISFTLNDIVAPTVTGKPISVTLTASGTVSITPQDVLVSGADACGIAGYSLSQSIFGANDAINSPVTVQLTATDVNGNQTSVPVQVTVIDPVPVVITQDIIAYLDANGNVTITPQQIDNGSSSVVGLSGLSLDLTSFNCSNVGNNTVTLTATSNLGSTASGTANVFVVDEIAPVISTQGATVQLNQNGFGSIVLSDILLSSADACGIASEAATKLSFDCTNVGANAVVITVTDNNGQITQQTVNVEVLDVLPIIAQNDAITLDTCAPITFSVSDLLGNDSDPYGETLKIDFVSQPSSGSIVDNGNGTFTYTPGQSTNHIATAEYLVKRNDGTIVFSGNGHFYEFVTAPGITWSAAKDAAEQRTYNGQQGYLVTITSAAENQFAFSKLNGQGWIGASDTQTEGQWRWVSGPEAGTLFYNQSTRQPINGGFNNWANGEPNNYTTGGYFVNGEDVAHFLTNGQWNDYPNNIGTSIAGYVVEYGGSNGDCNIQSTATATISFELNDIVAPNAQTQNITIDLDASGNASITTGMIDNGSNDACGIASFSLDKTAFDCSNVGVNTVTLTVTDVNNNVSSSTAQVTVRDVIAATVITQNITIDLDANGNASITTGMIDNGSNDACGIASFSLDKTTFDCTNVGANTVTLTVTDNNGNVSSNTAQVTVRDVIAPIAVTQNIVVQLDASGNAIVTPNQVDNGSNDACGIESVEFLTSSDGILRATANEGYALNLTAPSGSVITGINFASYGTPNEVNGEFVQGSCHSPFSMDRLQAAIGQNSFSIGAVNSTFGDPCGGTYKRLYVEATYSAPGEGVESLAFDCSNVGSNEVTLLVTDVNGNQSTATANVIIEDNIAAEVITQDITIDLDANGNASITTGMIDNGSNDACGIASFSLDKTAFDCTNVGANTVTLTVTDNNGNVSSNTAQVTVRDVIAPTVITQDIEVFLDENGQAMITPNSVNNGTFDNCTFELSIDNANFTCDNIGANTVTLTATDASGNTTFATATVTVSDVILPTVLPNNIDVFLDANGNTSITVANVDGGTYDNCGIASLTIDITSFDCDDLGANNVTLTATDVNGNVNTGVAIVTVIDNIAPTVGVQGITVSLDENGQASIVPEDVLLFTEADLIRDTECDLTASTDKYVMKVKGEYYKKGHKNTKGKGHDKYGDDDDDDNGKGKGKGHENDGDDDDDDYDNDKYDQYYFSNGKLLRSLDGSMLLTGTLTDDDQATDSYAVSITLVGAYDYATWKSMGGKVKEVKYSNNHLDWTYYSVQGGMLTGTGDNAGNNYPITAYKSEEGFQLGIGANGENLIEGLGGKFLSEIGKGELSLDISDCELLPVPSGTVYTSDNCSIVSYSFDQDTFSCNDYSETVVNLTATDQSGNTTTVPVTVTIVDNIAPTAVALDYITVSLGADGTVTIDPSMVDGGSYDNTDCITLSIDIDTFDCDDIGKGDSFYIYEEEESCKNHKHTHGKGHNYGDDDDDNDPGNGNAYGHKKSKKTKIKGHRVMLTVTDAAGNSDQVETYVVIVDDLGPVIAQGPVTIVVYDEVSGSGKKSKTKKNTEYVKDEDIEPLVSDNCEVYKIDFPKIKYSSDDAGMNQLEVTAKDKSGNVTVGMVNVEVIDITSLGTYINMCYKGNSVRVKNSSVQDYLRKGASLGNCGSSMNTQNKVLAYGETKDIFVAELSITSYPNPTTGFTTISISSNVEGPARVGIVSAAGVEIEEVYSGELQANEKFEVGFDGSRLASGVYIIRLVTAGQVKNLKLMIRK